MSKADHREQYAVFAEVLRKARKTAQLTQTEVAARLGRPQSFVAKYEGCERKLDVIDFLNVAKAIGVPWASLLQDCETELKKRY